ncbi:MAG: peptidase M14 [Anaerolineae bacterium]|nr:peptidase M14 [Gloeobacterales cyanobacterium ES-bin-313]
MGKSWLWSSLAVLCFTMQPASAAPDFPTKAEATNYLRTSRYDEDVAYVRRIAAGSEFAQVQVIGKTPEGREMVMLVLSKDKAFTPEAARATGKEIIFIQGGIHAGEIPGKDALLALARDMVISGTHRNLLDHAIVLFLPVFNVDGHERFGPYGRINQNGPIEMGWRTTAQNYNLNRDFLKADSPEMRAWLDNFARWLPDMVVDTHDTDGADFQHDLTYGIETHANLDAQIVAWQDKAFEKTIFPALQKIGHKTAPYLQFIDEKDLRKGFADSATEPRYSTGYSAIQNRSSILVETHMLKDYKTRVIATYDLLVEILTYIHQHPGELRKAVDAADQRTIARGKIYDATVNYPLNFEQGKASIPFTFQGYAYTRELSDISGSIWVLYDHSKPETMQVPFYNQQLVEKSVVPPIGYIIPVSMTQVIDHLKAHHIDFQTIDKPTTVTVETYKFDEVTWQSKPFENHIRTKSLKFTKIQKQIPYPAGSVVVLLSQRTGNVIMHLLEPDGPDSLVQWGFLDPIFEPKEYAEGYVMEKMAREMLAKDPQLARDFEQKVAEDPAFAASPQARLDFFYRRTPFYDERLNIYPIGRLLKAIP